MKNLRIFFVLLILPFLLASKANIETAIKDTNNLITKEKENLVQLRQDVMKKKMDLSSQLTQLQNEVNKLIERDKDLSDLSSNKDLKLKILKDKTKSLENELQLIQDTILAYRKEFSKNISPIESLSYKSNLESIDNSLDSELIQITQSFSELITLSLERNINTLSPQQIPGECLSSEGNLKKGVYIQIGPINYFTSDDHTTSGLVGVQMGSKIPSILKEISAEEMKKVINGQKGIIPFDVTLGKALKIDQSKGSLKEHIKTGGIIMIPILLLGAISLIITIFKFIQLKMVKTIKTSELENIISSLINDGSNSALKKANKYNAPLLPVLKEGIHHYNLSRDELEEVLHETIMLQVPRLEKGLWILSVTAASAPLLGLLGTVTGMIRTFNLVTIFGAGNANLLSGGISEALITTEFGLIVAIPVLLFHAYLLKKIKYIIHSMEQISISFVNGVKISSKGQS